MDWYKKPFSARNRHRKKVAGRLKTQAWARGVQRELKLKTAYQLAKQLLVIGPKKSQTVDWNNSRSRIWEKRLAGVCGPPRDGHMLDYLRDIAPIATSFLNHPIWEVAAGPPSRKRCHELLWLLDAPVRRLVHKRVGFNILRSRSSWYSEIAPQLSVQSNLDAVVALLILAQLSEGEFQTYRRYEFASRAYGVYLRAAAFDLDSDIAAALSDLLFAQYSRETKFDEFIDRGHVPWVPTPAHIDVEKVVRENKAILKAFPRLPSLSRRDYEQLLTLADSSGRFAAVSAAAGVSKSPTTWRDADPLFRVFATQLYEGVRTGPFHRNFRPWWITNRPRQVGGWYFPGNNPDSPTFECHLLQAAFDQNPN